MIDIPIPKNYAISNGKANANTNISTKPKPTYYLLMGFAEGWFIPYNQLTKD